MPAHWVDARGILCGVPLFPRSDSYVYPCEAVAHLVTCIDCQTIAALVEECEDDNERTEVLLRERARYAARSR